MLENEQFPPLRRPGEPEETAGAALFLASAAGTDHYGRALRTS